MASTKYNLTVPLSDSSGDPLVDRGVYVSLCDGEGNNVVGYDSEGWIIANVMIRTDATGTAVIPLIANVEITPANTYYKVEVGNYGSWIVLVDSDGTLSNLLMVATDPLATIQIEGPPGPPGVTLHSGLTDVATSGHPASAITGLGTAATKDVGAANGVAPLDSSSLVPDANIPSTITRDSELAASVSAAVTALVNSAPATLDTLAEIATALGNDPSLATTLTTAIGLKASKASNLSDLSDIPTARTNLGLGGAAVLSVGTTLGTVAAGDDSRFTDARTPTVHAASHAGGGLDPIISLGGTTFTGNIRGGDIGLSIGAGSLAPAGGQVRMAGTNPSLYFDRSGTSEFLLYDTGGILYLRDLTNSRMLTSWTRGAAGSAQIDLLDKTVVTSALAASVPLTVKGEASQTGNLTEWQNSAGTALVKVDANGNFSVLNDLNVQARYFTDISNNIAYFNMGTDSTHAVTLNNRTASKVGFSVKGASAQTADLQQWQDSVGTVQAAMTKDGRLGVGGTFNGVGGERLSIRSLAATGAFAIYDENGDVHYSVNGNGIFQLIPSPATAGATAKSSPSNQLVSAYWNGSASVSEIWSIQNVRLGAYQYGNTLWFQNSAGTLPLALGDGTVGTVGIGHGFPTSSLGMLHVRTTATTVVGQTIRGMAAQTADLQQWQDSTGAVLSVVGSAGKLGIGTTAPGYKLEVVDATTPKAVVQDGAGRRITLRGGTASVSPALLSYSGLLLGGTESATNDLFVSGGGLVGVGMTTPTSAQLQVNASAAATVGVIVKGAASQTASLQQWQDSTGAVLSSISATGNRLGPDGTVSLPGFSFVSDPDTGFYSLGANQLGIAVGGALRAYSTVSSFDTLVPLRSLSQAAGTVPMVSRGTASQSASLQEWQDSAGTVLASVSAAGLHKWAAGNEQTTVGAAGAASALPATPTKYLKVKGSDGTTYVVPAYAAA